MRWRSVRRSCTRRRAAPSWWWTGRPERLFGAIQKAPVRYVSPTLSHSQVNTLLSKVIDQRNKKLWEAVSNQRSISLVEWSGDHYGVYTIGDSSTIYITKGVYNPPSFAHELLHIVLMHEGVLIGNSLIACVRELPDLRKILSEPLLEHIGNCLEHVKMLPMFLELGYKSSEFISDYHANKIPEPELQRIERLFSFKRFFIRTCHNSGIVDLYIGKYFAIKACPNTGFDYAPSLRRLKAVDEDLFEVLDSFMTGWLKFDYMDKSRPGGYNQLLCDFIDNLTNWTFGKRFG